MPREPDQTKNYLKTVIFIYYVYKKDMYCICKLNYGFKNELTLMFYKSYLVNKFKNRPCH